MMLIGMPKPHYLDSFRESVEASGNGVRLREWV